MANADVEHGPPLLAYTGQPIVDVGVATILAFAQHADAAAVTAADIEDLTEFLIDHYVAGPLKSFMFAMLPNSSYVNPAMSEGARRTASRAFLGMCGQPSDPEAGLCLFCGRQAVGMVFRQHIPLIASQGVINFGPGGRPGVPVCGGCLLATQAFVLGCAIKCEGRALLVHSDDAELTLAFASTFLAENRRSLSLSAAGEEGSVKYPRTLVMRRLAEIDTRHSGPATTGASLTAYHITNYGQSPDIAIYHVPSQVLSFFHTARSEKYRSAWEYVVSAGWVRGKGKAGEAPQAAAGDEPDYSTKNRAFEDLFSAVERWPWYIRKHLLCSVLKADEAIEGGDTAEQRASKLSWELTELFLRKVAGMQKSRIEAIKQCGDRLADVIRDDSNKRLMRSVFVTTRYADFRAVLLKANGARILSGGEPVVTFDDFIAIFESTEDFTPTDWRLARDLLYLRILDSLYKAGWLQGNKEDAEHVLEQIVNTEDEPEARTATPV
jgi:CRISPR-associated protein Cst1